MWSMGGFSGEPDPEFIRRMSPPENEIPVAVPLNVVLGRTENAAIAMTGLQVYTTGIAFDLAVRVRSWPDDDHRGLSELVFDHGRRGGQLLVGVELSDGSRASNLGRAGPTPDPSGIVFHPAGGGGGQLAVDQSWWLSPVPPEGPLRFVCSCAPLDIAETSVELDGTAIARAVETVVTLWPWVPPDRGGRPPLPPPELPDESWFADPA